MQIRETDGEKLFFLFFGLDISLNREFVINSYLNFYLEEYISDYD